MINVTSNNEKYAYNDLAIMDPSMIFAELALAIGGPCGDKNRCNRCTARGRITLAQPIAELNYVYGRGSSSSLRLGSRH
jgi:hypothetical protein